MEDFFIFFKYIYILLLLLLLLFFFGGGGGEKMKTKSKRELLHFNIMRGFYIPPGSFIYIQTAFCQENNLWLRDIYSLVCL